MKEDVFLSVKDLAKLLQVNQLTIYRIIRSGKLSYYKIGRLKRVKKSDLISFLNKNRK